MNNSIQMMLDRVLTIVWAGHTAGDMSRFDEMMLVLQEQRSYGTAHSEIEELAVSVETIQKVKMTSTMLQAAKWGLPFDGVKYAAGILEVESREYDELQKLIMNR